MAKHDEMRPGFISESQNLPLLEADQWVRWTTSEHVFEGRVIEVRGPSAIVQWLGDDGRPQVFPVIEGYFPPLGDGMEIIDQPRTADRIDSDVARGRMSVRRAAALLGVEPKRVRAMLRDGVLEGVQREGRWIAVDEDSIRGQR